MGQGTSPPSWGFVGLYLSAVEGSQPSDGEHPTAQDEKLITTGPLALLDPLPLAMTF